MDIKEMVIRLGIDEIREAHKLLVAAFGLLGDEELLALITSIDQLAKRIEREYDCRDSAPPVDRGEP